MGEISTEGRKVWRDYNTDGVPSSGEHDPEKSGIRDLVDLLDEKIENVANLVTTTTQWKADVRVASTANVNIASGLENGDTIDGVTLATGDRVLLKNQSTASQNGIYVVVASGTASRSTDVDTGAEMLGATVYVREGSTNLGRRYTCNTPSPITLDTTSLTFVLTGDDADLSGLQDDVDDLQADVADLETAVDEIADDVIKFYAATGAPVVALGSNMKWDRDGVLGGSALTIYVPRSLYVSAGAVTLPSATYGTASSVLPDFVALTVSDDDVSIVYLDISDTTKPQKITNHPTYPSKTLPGTIFPLAIIRNYKIVWSITPVIEISNMSKDRVNLRYPLVVEKDKILVPTFYHMNRGDGITALYEPADGSRYWELNKQTSSGTEDRIVFDRVAAQAGNTPVKVISGTAQPRVPTDNYIVEIASVMTREVHTKHAVHGYTKGGLVPNQFAAGNDPDMAHLYDPGGATTVVDIANADLLALGFSRGVSGDSAFYGGFFPDSTPKKGYIFARFYVQAVADDVFGTPRLYIRGDKDILSTVDMVLEKKISARVASFIFFTEYSYSEQPKYYWLGQFQTGTARIVCGGQMYIGEGNRGWIARDDRPRLRRADILYPPLHYCIAGRELTFNPSAIVAERDDQGGYSLVVSKSSTYGLPYLLESRDSFFLDYAKTGTTLELATASRGLTSGLHFSRPLGVRYVQEPISGSKKILMIGDSLTLRGMIDILNEKLDDIGITPTFLGTIKGYENNTGTAQSVYSSLYGEGRLGWAFADYIYKNTAQPPVAPGDEATYLAKSDEGSYGDTRHNFNPFIREATGDDITNTPTYVHNGYIWDLDFYRTRFTPDIDAADYVLIGLGTNDINESDIEESLETIINGAEIMINQTAAALPAAKIIVWFPAPPRSGISDLRWRDYYVPAIRALIEMCEDLPNVFVAPTWAHGTGSAGWRITTQETTGDQTAGYVDDDLHPHNLNRQVIGEVLAQTIAGIHSGVGDDWIATSLSSQVSSLQGKIKEGSATPPKPVRWIDQLGFSLGGVSADGGITTPLLKLEGSLNVPQDVSADFSSDIPGVRIRDSMGFVGVRIRPGENPESTLSSDGTSISAAEITAFDGKILGISALNRASIDSGFQRPLAGYNVILVYGQSLGLGRETWPALTRTAPMTGVKMLGDAVRPEPFGETYIVVGSTVLNAAVARDQSPTTGFVLSEAAVAAFSPGNDALGEEPGIAAAYTFRKLWLDHLLETEDDSRQLIVINCSISGKTVAELSSGASPNYFASIVDGFTKLKARADAESKPIRLVATIFMQGEQDYTVSTALATYKTAVIQLRNDIQAAAASAFGTQSTAQFITYQTSGSYAEDDLAIAEAQKQLANEQPYWHIAAPSYSVTDKGAHLDANGSRWLGCQIGKALFETLIMGRRPVPMQAIEAVHRGTTLLLGFNVPVPPIQFRDFYEVNTATSYTDKGITVIDTVGVIGISSIEVAGSATLKISLVRSPVGAINVYGGRLTTFNGALNISDSDAMVPPFNYQYLPGTGMYASADIPALNDKPYPLNNFSAAFIQTSTAI
jgi:lysophospholipase L1-like esterase